MEKLGGGEGRRRIRVGIFGKEKEETRGEEVRNDGRANGGDE